MAQLKPLPRARRRHRGHRQRFRSASSDCSISIRSDVRCS